MAFYFPGIKRLPYLYPHHLSLTLRFPLAAHRKEPGVSKNRNRRWIIKAAWFQLALPARRYRCLHLHIRILLPNRSRFVHPADIGTLYCVFLNIAHFRTCAAPGKVSKIYGTKEVKIIAVDEISFNISKGEFAVI